MVKGRRVASTPEMAAEQRARFAAVSAARRCSASTIGRSSGGQSAFVAALVYDVDFDAALGAAFSEGIDVVGGGLNDSPIQWGIETR